MVHELLSLKVLFGVSAQAIAYGCKDLGNINQAAFTEIFRIFNARGWRTSDPRLSSLSARSASSGCACGR